MLHVKSLKTDMNEFKKKSYLRYVDFEDQFNKAYMIVEV